MAKGKTPGNGGNIWIFQYNPDVFNLDEYLRSGSGTLAWEVNQHADEISPGDTVYLWRDTSRAVRARATITAARPFSRAARMARLAARPGIVAVATVAGPVFRGIDETDGPSFRTDLALPELRERVLLRIVDSANGREAIRREWLMADPVCRDMTILDRPRDTNIAVSPAHAERLSRLWERAGTNLTDDELVAILHCYTLVRAADPGAGAKRTWSTGAAKAPDKQARAAADKAVGDCAVMIGRAVGGVRLALAKFRAIDPGSSGRGLAGATSIYRDVFSRYWDQAGNRLSAARIDNDFGRIWLGASDDGLLI